jgi:GT2 family glycosyltransferase
VGDFDEIFYPAYYEDSDYLYRMKIKGKRQEVEEKLNPEVIRISMTQEKSPEFVNASMQANRLRYIEKWGNSPLLETFLTPYNK